MKLDKFAQADALKVKERQNAAQIAKMKNAFDAKVEALRQREDEYKRRIKSLEGSVDLLKRQSVIKFRPGVIRKIRSSGDGYLNIALPDIHGSHMDKPAIGAALHDIKRLNLNETSNVILLGDLLECGGFLAAHHTLGYVADVDEVSYQDDCIAASWFLDELMKISNGAAIHYIEGNHEHRVEQWAVTQSLGSGKDAAMLYEAFSPEIKLSLKQRGIMYYKRNEKYHGLEFPGVIKIGKCHYTHGASISRHAAAKHAEMYGANIVYGDTHRADSWISRSLPTGIFGAWNPGCLCKLFPRWRHSSPSTWSHGYGIDVMDKAGGFLHINVPIKDGRSYLGNLIR
jgi:hypothetical protein